MSCYGVKHSLLGLEYKVTNEGLLVLTGMAMNHRFRKITIKIPEILFLEGTDAIRKYAEEKAFESIKTQAEESKRLNEERLVRLRTMNVEIGTKCDGVYLKGRVTYNDNFVVTLEEPPEYSDKTILRIPSSKWGPHNLLIDGCKPSLQALTEASERLVSMYRLKRKREKYPLAHAVLDKLEG